MKNNPISLFSKQVFVSASLAASIVLSGCMSTAPSLGAGSSTNTITGSAAGTNSANANSALESCDEPLGTLSLFEDRSLPWWGDYRRRLPDLGSTTPVIRTMIQQSNCFVVVERGRAMEAMNRERQLMQAGQLRTNSNIGGGQMVSADFTVSPSIQFSEKTGGMKAVAGALLGSFGSIVGGGLSKNEASTTLLLIDNRSGVQVASSVGSAGNYDFDLFGGFFAGIAGGGKGFTKSPEGKIISAAFADSYNQMVMALRNYKPQRVKGGLGTGGGLEVDGQVQATSSAGIVPAPAPSRPPVVIETRNTSTVTTNSNFNARIDQYDEDAMQDYYRHLKQAAETMTTMAEMGSAGSGATPGGMDFKTAMSAAVNMFSSQLDGAAIELEAWPASARAEGWRVLGKRIERYSDMFYKNRDRALQSAKLDDTVRTALNSITLLTKEDFLN